MIGGSSRRQAADSRSSFRDMPESVRRVYDFNSRWYPIDRHASERVAASFVPSVRVRHPLRLHFIDEGPHLEPGASESATDPLGRDVETLLCVHGNPTWSFYFRHVVARFADRRRVIAVDHRGLGMRDKPRGYPYRLANHIANLETLVEGLDLRRITLVMHDWGGAIGMGLATRQPARIERWMILNTAAFAVPRLPLRIALCRVPGLGRWLVRGLNGFARAALRWATERPEALRASGAAEGLLWPYRPRDSRVAIHRFVHDIPMSPRHASWETLAAIEQGLTRLAHLPTWIGWGMRDWCFSPKPFLDEWVRRFPHAEVQREESAGHYVLEDATESILQGMASFLDRHPTSART